MCKTIKYLWLPISLVALAPSLASSAPLRRKQQWRFEYAVKGRNLQPKPEDPQRPSAVPLNTGDVAVISTKALDKPQSTLSATCVREEEEKYKCGFFNLQTCTRKNIIRTPVTRTLAAMGIEQHVFFTAKDVGAITPGAKKVFVAPKDGSLALGAVDIEGTLDQLDREAATLCPSGEQTTDKSTHRWYESAHLEAVVTVCRSGVSEDKRECVEARP